MDRGQGGRVVISKPRQVSGIYKELLRSHKEKQQRPLEKRAEDKSKQFLDKETQRLIYEKMLVDTSKVNVILNI